MKSLMILRGIGMKNFIGAINEVFIGLMTTLPTLNDPEISGFH